MTITYNVDDISKCVDGNGTEFSDQVISAKIAADTDTSLTVPSPSALGMPQGSSKNKFYAVISTEPGKSVFVASNAVAAAPAGAAFAQGTSELVSKSYLVKSVKGGDLLHFLSVGNTAFVTVAFFSYSAG